MNKLVVRGGASIVEMRGYQVEAHLDRVRLKFNGVRRLCRSRPIISVRRLPRGYTHPRQRSVVVGARSLYGCGEVGRFPIETGIYKSFGRCHIAVDILPDIREPIAAPFKVTQRAHRVADPSGDTCIRTDKGHARRGIRISRGVIKRVPCCRYATRSSRCGKRRRLSLW